MTPILHQLIASRAACRSWAIETISLDSTGFSTCGSFAGSMKSTAGAMRKGLGEGPSAAWGRTWSRPSKSTGGTRATARLRACWKHRRAVHGQEVSADKAYAARTSQGSHKVGGTAYIPFKCKHDRARGRLFEKVFHYYNLHREEFPACTITSGATSSRPSA